MKALILIGVSVVLGLGMVLANSEPLSGAQNVSDGNWKNPSAWNRVKDGMSERQVISVLGTPTGRKIDILGFSEFCEVRDLILLYQGEVEGSGHVSGNVKLWLDEDQVYAINRPVF